VSPLALEPSLEGFQGAGRTFVELNPALAWSPQTAPLPDQGSIPEQAGLDLQDIVTSHVAAWVAPVQDQIVDRVVSHARVSFGPLTTSN
jgi:hypothetical protein